MILKDIKKLEPSYIPDKILCRDEQLRLLSSFMKGGRAIISGGVGTGKTLMAKYFGGDAYVNCYVNRTEHKVLENIISQLKPNFRTRGLSTSSLWNELEEDKILILDEIDGMLPEELRHFSYTISRMKENGRNIKYIAITRSHTILKQIINDDAIWSSFADKAIVELRNYTWKEIREILWYRAKESIRDDAIDDDVISLIAEISLVSPGHMRAGIELMKNSALIAEGKGEEKIQVEDVREANREGWLSDIDSLGEKERFILYSIAIACRDKAYVKIDEIKNVVKLKEEEMGISIKNDEFDRAIETLLRQEFAFSTPRGYAILTYPCKEIIERVAQ